MKGRTTLAGKHYAAICSCLLLVSVMFYFGHWFGFALAVVFLALVYGYQVLMALQAIRDVLRSSLTERCAMCHREIVDEGGVIGQDLEGATRLYHSTCSDKMSELKALWEAEPALSSPRISYKLSDRDWLWLVLVALMLVGFVAKMFDK
jgi:hypothetical protein